MSFEQAVVQLEQTNAALQEEVVRFRDAAMGLNAIYPTITEGRQAVSDGKYFSVPGGGAYMRLYRRQGSSAQLIAEFPDRAELNSVIDQLGPLLGRGVVGGSGNLMAEGAFGLGNAEGSGLSVTDDSLRPTEFTRYPSSAFSPFGSAGMGFRTRYTADGSAQELHIGATDGELRTRRGTGNGATVEWQPVARYYSDRNILGTVSQSGGVPTGAIIERGSNSFGEWIKFADGTLINLMKQEINLSAGATINITPPVTPLGVVADQRVFVSWFSTSSSAEARAGCIAENGAGNTALIRNASTVSFTAGVAATITMIGRWY